jgi:hypothetical protein
MTEWVPFFQALIWPAFVGGILWFARVDLARVGRAFVTRIEQGDPIEAGTSGIKLGSSKQSQDPDVKLLAPDTMRESQLPNKTYLVHSAKRDRRLDKGDLEYYRLRIWLDADEPEMLDEVASVTYHLHPTFQEPVRIVVDRANDFALSTAAWGQFNMYAEVKFKSQRPVLAIERYIDF